MSELISIREYARRLSINEKAVRKAIGAGQIVEGYDKELKKIIPGAANAEWGYKHEVLKPRSGISLAQRLKKMEKAPATTVAPKAPDPVRSAPDGASLDDPAALDLLQDIVIKSTLVTPEAVRLREVIGAQLDKLKLAEAEGRLVPKDKVYRSLFALGNELKKALLNIPTRVVRDIMAAANEVEGINILTDEINAALSTFGNLRDNAL